MAKEIPIQEQPSTYFSDVIRTGVKPVSVDELDPTILESFNQKTKEAFPNNAEIVKRRLHYIAPYLIGNLNIENNGGTIHAWQLQYFYQRDRFMQKTGLDYQRFLEHAPMQRSLVALGLDPVSVFEFILFLRYYYSLRAELRFSSAELFKQLMELLKADKTTDVSMDVNIGGKHFKFSNSQFVREILDNTKIRDLDDPAFVNDFDQGGLREKLRALDYYVIKTLLDYLPIKKNDNIRGRFSQAERNFGLSVLSICGRLPDIDREGECSHENNATFDKLFRDFQNQPTPFAMELYLL